MKTASTWKELAKRARMALLLRTRVRLRHCGARTYVAHRVVVAPNTTWIGADGFIGGECWLSIPDLRIGDWVMLAGRVAVVGGDHRFDQVGVPSIHAGRAERKPVVIEDDVWVGFGATILHGVRIGEGSVVAAGAIVTRDVAPYTIVAGIPAAEVRRRFLDPGDERRHRDELEKRRAALRSEGEPAPPLD